MNATPQKRHKTLTTFIKKLTQKREEFRKEKKSGAGCATEAIEFYQYVLSINKTFQQDSSSSEEEEEEDSDGHNDQCEVCAQGGELLCCSTCNLVFHLQCTRPVLKSTPRNNWSCAFCDASGVTGYKKESRLRKKARNAVKEMKALQLEHQQQQQQLQQDQEEEEEEEEHAESEHEEGDATKDHATDVTAEETKEEAISSSELMESTFTCKVCSYGGDLISCNQDVCENKFHVQCVRPLLDDKPTDWNCAYCDVDFVTGLKPQARKRRAALSGVRAMEKLKVEYDSKRKANLLPQQMMGSPGSTGKRSRDENTTASTSVVANTPMHPGQPRSKRIRKQRMDLKLDQDSITDTSLHSMGEEEDEDEQESTVTLTEPLYTRDMIPNDLIKRLTPRATNSNSRHGQYNCKFCMDDEKTTTCCFCACRVCFTKHHKNDTILCDLCDGEYHLNCLAPKLSKVPDFEWFCPTCVDAIKEALAAPKAKPERKKKSTKNVEKPTVVKKGGGSKAKAAKLLLKQKKAAYSAMQPRTSSGRFASKSEKKVKPSTVAAVVVPVKRGRGRPPKNPALKAAAVAAAAKKATSPKKATTPTKRTSTGRPVGRPRKDANKPPVVEPVFVEPEEVEKTVEHRSRSGRVVKRKAAYDEREEGPQLLKASTSASVSSSVAKKDVNEEEVVQDMEVSGGTAETESKKSISEAAAVAANVAATLLEQQANDNVAYTPSAIAPTMTITEVKMDPIEIIQPPTIDAPSIHAARVSNKSPSTVSVNDVEKASVSSSKSARRKPGARECMQISRRFGADVIPQQYMDILFDYCARGKVEHLIRMRERLDEHSRYLEQQLAGLEMLVLEKGGDANTSLTPTVANVAMAAEADEISRLVPKTAGVDTPMKDVSETAASNA